MSKSKAKLKKIAKRIAELEQMRANPSLCEMAEEEINKISNQLSFFELFEIDELVMKYLKK